VGFGQVDNTAFVSFGWDGYGAQDTVAPKNGETLAQIAERMNVDLAVLAKANPGIDPNKPLR